MIGSNFDSSRYNLEKPELYRTNSFIYLQIIFFNKQWDRLIDYVKTTTETKDLLLVLKKSDLTNDMFKTFSDDQIVDLLRYSHGALRIKVLKLIRNQCDSNPHLPEVMGKIASSLENNSFILESFKEFFVCLPVKTIETVLSGIIPAAEVEDKSSDLEIYFASQDPRFHFTKLDAKGATGNTLTFNINNFNGRRKVRRVELQKAIFNVASAAFKYIQTLDPESPIVPTLVSRFSTFLVGSYGESWQAVTELRAIARGIVEDFDVAKVFPNIIHQITSMGLGVLNRCGLDYLFFEKAELITQQYVVEHFFVPACLAEIENKEKHQSNVKQMARYVFGQASDAFLAMRTSFLEDPQSPLGRVWSGIIKAVAPVAVEDIIDVGQSRALDDLLYIMSRNGANNENAVICSFEEAMGILKSVIDLVIEAKPKIASTDARKYSRVVVYLILKLKEQGTYGDVFDTIAQLYEEGAPTVWDTLIDEETRDRLVVEAIRHPTQPTKFAAWVTERPTCVLVKMVSMLSSITKAVILLPESKRSALDEYGFQTAKAVFPRTHSQGRGKPTTETQKMSLLEAFIMRTKFWESKDADVLRQNLEVYAEFAKKAIVEALQKKDAKLTEAVLGIHKRLLRFLVGNLGSSITNEQFDLAVKMLCWPCVLELGSSDDKFVESMMEIVKEMPILTRGKKMPRVSVVYNLMDATHSEYTPHSDAVAAKLLEKTLASIYSEFPAGIRSVAAESVSMYQFQMMPRAPIAEFTKRRIDSMSQRKLPEVARTFDRVNEFPIPAQQVMPPLDPALYANYEEICDTKTGREFPVANGQAVLKALEFVAARSEEYKPEMYKESKTVFVQFVKDNAQNIFERMLRMDFEFPKPDPMMVANIDDYINHCQEFSKGIRYSRGMLESLGNILKPNSSCRVFMSEEAFAVVKKVFEFEFEDQKNAAKVKDKKVYTGSDFQIGTDNNIRQLQKELELRDFYIQLLNLQSNAYSSLMGSTEGYRRDIENLKKYSAQELPSYMKWLTECPHIETPEKLDPIRNSIKQNGTTNSYAQDFFIEIYDKVTGVKDAAATAKAMLEDHRTIPTLMQFLNTGASIKGTRLMAAVIEVLCQDLVGMKKRVRSAFLAPNEPTTNAGYQMARDQLMAAGTILRKGHGKVDIALIPSLDAFARLPEKVLQEGLENLNSNLEDFVLALILSVDFGEVENNLTWVKEHGSPVFRLFHSPLFAQSFMAIDGVLKSEFGCRRMAVLTGLESAIVNGKYAWQDVAIVRTVKKSLNTDFVGFPAPESSFNFLQELAKTNSSPEVLRAILASSVEYIRRQELLHVKKPDHAERVLEVMRAAHKQNPDEMTPFILQMLSNQATYAMRESPALRDIADKVPALYADWAMTSMLPHAGEYHWLYERVVSEFVCSGLVSKKPHIVELIVKVIGSLKLGKELPKEIAPFVTKGLEELNPADDSVAFLKFAVQFVTKAEHQQFAGAVDSFMGVFGRLQEYARKVCAARAKQLLLPRSEQTGADETEGLSRIYNAIVDTFEQEVCERLQKELKQEDRADLAVLSQVAGRAAKAAAEARPMIILHAFTRMEDALTVIGDENFASAVSTVEKEEALSAVLRLLVSSRKQMVGGVTRTVRALWDSTKAAMVERHVREAAEWPSEMAAHPSVAFIADTVVEKFPRSLGETETLELVAKLGMFFASRPRVINESAPLGGGRVFGSAIGSASAAVDSFGAAPRMMMRKMMKPMAAPPPPMECPMAPQVMMAAPAPQPMMMFARGAPAVENDEISRVECCEEENVFMAECMDADMGIMAPMDEADFDHVTEDEEAEDTAEEDAMDDEDEEGDNSNDEAEEEEGDVFAFWE